MNPETLAATAQDIKNSLAFMGVSALVDYSSHCIARLFIDDLRRLRCSLLLPLKIFRLELSSLPCGQQTLRGNAKLTQAPRSVPDQADMSAHRRSAARSPQPFHDPVRVAHDADNLAALEHRRTGQTELVEQSGATTDMHAMVGSHLRTAWKWPLSPLPQVELQTSNQW
jgi:hypothetical protein